MDPRILACCWWLAVTCSVGCLGGQRRIKPPHIDPAAAADAAIALYDANDDQVLDASELAACPAILGKLAAYDQDQDGTVTRDEIQARLTSRRKSRVGLMRMQARVQLNGQPLAAAEVTFEPEPYLGDEIKAARGTTNASGVTAMAIPPDQLPASQQHLNALQVGSYKVRITHPEIDLPAKYNTQTELGFETESGQSMALFTLKTARK